MAGGYLEKKWIGIKKIIWKTLLVIIHFSGGGGVRRYILEFSRTGLIVYIVKTRAGGPTARLLAGYRAAGPLLGYFQERTLVLTQF